MSQSYDFKSYEKDTLERPRDKAWDNWWKRVTVGDKVQGYICDVFYRPAEGDFSAQRVLTLEQVNGEFINVSVKTFPFILSKTDALHLGDPLTVIYEEQKEPSRKGINGVKVDGFYGKQLDENKDKPTVSELYQQSVEEGGYVLEAKDAETEVDAAFDDFGTDTPPVGV